ncbi:RES family NAD+ phosphorylase [Agrobacterium rhizogenes]|uniref:RES family NAD+ phosphorylase n=1 Tax=Rhizobium rhizogenes TaxID=359 RepID=UPI000569E426|nr:RES family NAD+ phosphorylase [Rhizobium rhizogenes]NTF80395.1 RES family NAD+ phosphorylase [Rhizobium rhizogenes]NTH17857.1 RES family NAD+ phosphorylase [Rhizobium rhizogenes]NTH30829.1 RES family NAD+ phosphorylase [Rhizobium rhizogenes]NTH76486.1 RES family NAD+ phosphorylase [Rhizobium rhizogenes]NTH82494.1 RES family NAD+ phosphorylase [Rhizobium rhizogenes]
MSLPIWTPDALSSEARPISGRYWRLVEAQHQVSTLKLVDTLEEQALLETLLEESKPALPPECAGLDYLLATPFRYGAIYPYGSRFRRAGRTLGVFYASEQVETALAEMSFYRLLFFSDSPGTPLPANAAEYTAFAAVIATKQAVDLTLAPLERDREAWADPVNYEACQSLADAARAGKVDAILYQSVRDPKGGKNIALLTAHAFAAREPVERQTWRIRLSPAGVQALCEFPKARLGFARSDFGDDPRMRG